MGEKTEKHEKKNKKVIYENVRKQLEFYFSDAALSKDRFLNKLIEADPLGFVSLDVFLTFNKIKNFTDKLSDLVKAISSSAVLILNDDHTKVKRKVPLLPYDADSRTIYVESIPSNSTMQSLVDIFQVYGPVAYVSLPKYHNTNRIKGFAFIEFNSTEDAKKCLEAFTAMGCKLPNSISPEELLTCTTFQHENSSNNEKDVDNSADEYCEPPLKNKSKRQHSEEDNNLNETVPYEPPVKKTKTETANKLNKKNLKHKKTTESPIETKSKTAKISSSIKENTDNLPTEKLSDKSDENNECPAKKKKKLDDKTEGTEKTTTGIVQPEVVNKSKLRNRKKKDRKKKIKLKEKKNMENSTRSLQILSKTEWKVLRNKYLNMQRKHMKALKQVLRTRHTLLDNTPNLGANESEQNVVKKVVIQAPPPIQFVEGVIVAVKLPEPCIDVKNFKKSTKANVHVKYVDIKEGQSRAHIRFDNTEFAKQFSTSGVFTDCHILTGQEEKDYWEELTRLQSTDKRKIRGRDRLVNKAQELAAKCGHRTPAAHTNKHIRFDD